MDASLTQTLVHSKSLEIKFQIQDKKININNNILFKAPQGSIPRRSTLKTTVTVSLCTHGRYEYTRTDARHQVPQDCRTKLPKAGAERRTCSLSGVCKWTGHSSDSCTHRQSVSVPGCQLQEFTLAISWGRLSPENQSVSRGILVPKHTCMHARTL